VCVYIYTHTPGSLCELKMYGRAGKRLALVQLTRSGCRRPVQWVAPLRVTVQTTSRLGLRGSWRLCCPGALGTAPVHILTTGRYSRVILGFSYKHRGSEQFQLGTAGFVCWFCGSSPSPPHLHATEGLPRFTQGSLPSSSEPLASYIEEISREGRGNSAMISL